MSQQQQVVYVNAPQYANYGYGDPNEVCSECNPVGLCINFFVVLILGYLGLAFVTRPLLTPDRVPASYQPHSSGGSANCLCLPNPCYGADPCRECESIICCTNDCYPHQMLARDAGAKCGAVAAMWLRWIVFIPLFLCALVLAIMVILLFQGAAEGFVVGGAIGVIAFIILLGVPAFFESLAAGLYFLWYFFTHGKAFQWHADSYFMYMCVFPSPFFWLVAAVLGCCIFMESASGTHLFGARYDPNMSHGRTTVVVSNQGGAPSHPPAARPAQPAHPHPAPAQPAPAQNRY